MRSTPRAQELGRGLLLADALFDHRIGGLDPDTLRDALNRVEDLLTYRADFTSSRIESWTDSWAQQVRDLVP